MNLKNKQILITAGPTWVAIDSVRVISNIATGKTGILLAEKLQDLGARVTLLLGPIQNYSLNKKIRVIPFIFFDELKNIIIQELKSRRYDIVIHSAAVSDYRLRESYTHKVKSNLKEWQLNLVPTTKIIDLIRKIDCDLFIAGFRFEPRASKQKLLRETRKLIERANLDLAVANSIDKTKYRAYIINHHKSYGPLHNKKDLAERLVRLLGA